MSTSARSEVERLRDDLAGTVILPGDGAIYDEARTPFYGGIDRHPSAIVRAADTDDVRRVIAVAREGGLELEKLGGRVRHRGATGRERSCVGAADRR